MKSSRDRWCLWLTSAAVITSLMMLADGTGDWSEWGQFSPCSRLCGGGVKTRERICLDARFNSCIGKKRHYESCNLQDCSLGSPDFIVEQCSEFDIIPFNGQYYRWTPYEKGRKGCELLCTAEGLSTHHKLRDKVVDGTPCGQKPFSICVNGHCMLLGCDGRLGSEMTLDGCGVCGGNSTSCSLIDHSGIFNKKTLSSGYNKVVIIPSGSVAVEIKEMGPTLNTLVLVDGSGDQVVLAQDVQEAEYLFADTVFLFNTHEQQGQLHAAGPTTNNITVYMHNEGDWNPGISYHYKSVQNDLSIKPLNIHHNSQKLSKGMKSHVDVYEQRTLDSSNKQNEGELLDSKGSNILTFKDLDLREEIQNIPQNMLIDTDNFNRDSDSNSDGLEYGSYNHMIDSKGREPVSRAHAGSIWHKNAHGNIAKEQEDDVIRRFPEYFSNVRESSERYLWSFGDWTGCSRKCGQGVKQAVKSYWDIGIRVSLLAKGRLSTEFRNNKVLSKTDGPQYPGNNHDAHCTFKFTRHHDSSIETITMIPRWQPGEWGPCSSSCDIGEQVQEVVCQAVTEEGRTAVVRDDRCYKEYGSKPEYIRSCNEDFPCPEWSFTAWSECSVTCGRGEQKRYVFCHQETAIDSGRLKRIADSFCDINMKPVEYRLCSSGPCPRQHHQNRTRPRGFQQSCVYSHYSCCPDGVNPAKGPRGEGCPSQENIVISEDDAKNKPKCLDLEFGCCWDQVTPASGPNSKGCPPRDNSKSQAWCNSHPDMGSCRNFTVKWFYNSNTTQCDRFWYGGCDGNDNRFSDEKECLDACKNYITVEKDICDLPAVVGPCRASHLRWYYEAAEKKCKNFTYGGCDGNDNRFRTQAECERRCSSTVQALGDDREPVLLCEQSRYGCCQDGVTPATGPNSEGCPKDCQNTRYGCCDDGITAAQGEDGKGCEGVAGSGDIDTFCEESVFGCCPDGTTPAQGEKYLGCEDVVSPPDSDSGFYIEPVTTGACELPKDTGPCRHDLKVMWYYNSATGLCDRFWYGGCDGNSNRFKSEKECLATCRNVDDRDPMGTAVKIPMCEQEKKTGICKAHFVHWFHNSTSRQCEQFVYGGCEGNDNNFETREACEERCIVRIGPVEPSRNVPVCEQPQQQGLCFAYFPRWFYNRTSDRCEQFIYGGCQGNDNNFETKEACGARCPSRASTDVIFPVAGPVEPSRNVPVCEQPKQQGFCLASVPRWFYNRTSDRCEQFIYGGCQGNDNNFETKEACGARCPSRASTDVILPVAGGRTPVCQLEPDMGPCRRAETKWYYDVATFSCKTFIYGGCLGNHNNFQTKEKCEEYCNAQPGRSVRETCLSSREPGSCTAQFRRWYYDAQTGRCSEFIYGGCQGNGNSFLDEESCAKYCRGIRLDGRADNRVVTHPPQLAPQPDDICRLPLKTPCNDNTGLQYWYYDYNEGVCREVLEGQCNDNHNNFQSKEQCDGYCSRETVCRPFTQGMIVCDAAIPRWQYNRETNKCEEFLYGGCGGTSNNFRSRDACRRKCFAQGEQPVDNQAVVDSTTPEEICALNLEDGNALSGQQHWYYDKLTGQCKEFTGSSENRNNFASRELCEGYCTRRAVCQEFVDSKVSCYAYIPRWRYNPRIGRCEYFVYGGCGGNANNFEREEDCTRKCVHQMTPVREPSDGVEKTRYNSWHDICKHQADVGPCTNYVRKWHYNALTRECEEFTYGGCLGNHNNFESVAQCKMYCDQSRVREPQVEIGPGSGAIQGVEVCHLDIDTGTCDSRLQMWYYDYPSGVCKQFVYRGCDGNDNRFDTREECEGICNAAEICRQPMVIGQCRANFPRYYFDMRIGECREFGYGGCDGNANNFAAKEGCEHKCGYLAKQRPKPAITKTGYCPPVPNNVVGKCEEACRSDGDCPGDQKCCSNGCGHTCVTPVESATMKTVGRNENSVCSKPRMQGDCNGHEIMWYYDPVIKDCRRFVYTGCGGNGNRFSTGEECRNMCQGTSGVTWRPVPTDSTPQKYISTSTTKTETNVIVIPVASDVCHIEEKRELCTKYEVKWFFDKSIQRCNRFWYGGCEGRGNKFDTEEECQDICVNRKHGEQVTPIPTPQPITRPPESDCRRSQYGCCRDGRTPAIDRYFSNCPETITDCRLSRFGCCPDGVTATVDRHYSNCRVNRTDGQTERDDEFTQVLAQPGKRAVMTCFRESYNASIAWYREGLLITPDNNFFIYPNGTLVIQFVSSGDVGSYSCRITYGNVLPTIRRFKLIVQEPIRILSTPDTIIVKPGHTAFLHCQAQGSPQPRVSWSKGNEPIRSGGRFDVFENGTLLIARTQTEDIDYYVCRAENGISIAMQRTVRLSLREMLMAKIVSHQNQVTEGGRISLHCSGSGFPTPTIQWEKMGRPITTGGNVYVSDGRLVIRDVTPEDTGVYTCIVANNEEKIESSTTIQVMPKDIQADRCKDIAGEGKCRLIVYAGLCSYKMYSTICCSSCQSNKSP